MLSEQSAPGHDRPSASAAKAVSGCAVAAAECAADAPMHDHLSYDQASRQVRVAGHEAKRPDAAADVHRFACRGKGRTGAGRGGGVPCLSLHPPRTHGCLVQSHELAKTGIPNAGFLKRAFDPVPPPPQAPPNLEADTALHGAAALRKHVSCGLCGRVVASSLVLACGHAFCGACLFEHVNEKPSCPTCQVTSAAGMPRLRAAGVVAA
eukprot:362018-Chlamydomonas_euryale.AAC.11